MGSIVPKRSSSCGVLLEEQKLKVPSFPFILQEFLHNPEDPSSFNVIKP